MRYVILLVLGMLSTVLSGTVFSVVNIAGICPDLLFLCIFAIMLLEQTATPVLFGALFGIVYDILYCTAVGMNALAYAVSAAVFCIIMRRQTKINPLTIAIAGFGGYVLKELILAVVVGLSGASFSFGYMLWRYILPGGLMAAALLFPAYYLMGRLYANPWMRPALHSTEDIGRL